MLALKVIVFGLLIACLAACATMGDTPVVAPTWATLDGASVAQDAKSQKAFFQDKYKCEVQSQETSAGGIGSNITAIGDDGLIVSAAAMGAQSDTRDKLYIGCMNAAGYVLKAQ